MEFDLADWASWAIFLVLLASIAFGLFVVWLTWRRGYSLIKIEDGALSPSSIQTFVALVAAAIGGLWVAFTVATTGSLQLQRLAFEQAKLKNTPSLDISLETEVLAAAEHGASRLYALVVNVKVQNKSPRAANGIDLKKIPLLVVARVRGDEPNGAVEKVVARLPYVKLRCVSQTDCSVTEWKTASLEPEGWGYYTFLHPALPAGLYYLQFQLPIPDELIQGPFDRTQPVLWTRGQYVQVSEQQVKKTDAQAEVAKPVLPASASPR